MMRSVFHVLVGTFNSWQKGQFSLYWVQWDQLWMVKIVKPTWVLMGGLRCWFWAGEEVPVLRWEWNWRGNYLIFCRARCLSSSSHGIWGPILAMLRQLSWQSNATAWARVPEITWVTLAVLGESPGRYWCLGDHVVLGRDKVLRFGMQHVWL